MIRDGEHWKVGREDMLSSNYRRSAPCDPMKDISCTGDGEFYANQDWDAYSDGEGGQRYFADEIARRYQGDIKRCMALGRATTGSGTLAGKVVAGGRLRDAEVMGLDTSVSHCIGLVASKTWLFADPNESAQNDYTPASVAQGFVALRVPLRGGP
jgi:hypothetical protein